MSEDPIGFKGKDTNLTRYIENNVAKLTDYNGLRCCNPVKNPVNNYSCCKKFERFYDAFPVPRNTIGLTDAEKADKCAEDILSGIWWRTWWGEATVGATSVVIGVVNLPAGIAAGGGLMGINLISYFDARWFICDFYVCSSPSRNPTCFCSTGILLDTWTCRCPFGSDIYSHNSSGLYFSNPGGKSNVIEKWVAP
jgi:hypothetical protein